MKSMIATAMLVVAANLVSVAAGAAKTCTDRQQVCFAYCEKSMNNSSRCRDACGNLLSECMASGCWESKVAAKQCGFAAQ